MQTVLSPSTPLHVRSRPVASRRAARGRPNCAPVAALPPAGAALHALHADAPSVAAAQLVAQTADGGDVAVALGGFAAVAGLAYLLITTDPDKRYEKLPPCQLRQMCAVSSRCCLADSRGGGVRSQATDTLFQVRLLSRAPAPLCFPGGSRWRRQLAVMRWRA